MGSVLLFETICPQHFLPLLYRMNREPKKGWETGLHLPWSLTGSTLAASLQLQLVQFYMPSVSSQQGLQATPQGKLSPKDSRNEALAPANIVLTPATHSGSLSSPQRHQVPPFSVYVL